MTPLRLVSDTAALQNGGGRVTLRVETWIDIGTSSFAHPRWFFERRPLAELVLGAPLSGSVNLLIL